MSGNLNIRPTVWRIRWPKEVAQRLVSTSNPTGDLTINDLEMAGLLLQYLVLEQLVNLRHTHVSAWCDNSSTVSWARKMSSKRSIVGRRLVRALGLRIAVNEASPLVPVTIAGKNNPLADFASRSFGTPDAPSKPYHCSEPDFLHIFNTSFPLPDQDTSWQLFQLSDKLSSLVFSELLTRHQPMASWRRITTRGGTIGRLGAGSAASSTLTPVSL